MKKIAEWQDSRSKGVTYRLASNQECFVLEKRGEDSQGDPRWDEVKRFPRMGVEASITTILAIGLEEVQTQRRGRGLPEKAEALDPALRFPLDTIISERF